MQTLIWYILTLMLCSGVYTSRNWRGKEPCMAGLVGFEQCPTMDGVFMIAVGTKWSGSINEFEIERCLFCGSAFSGGASLTLLPRHYPLGVSLLAYSTNQPIHPFTRPGRVPILFHFPRERVLFRPVPRSPRRRRQSYIPPSPYPSLISQADLPDQQITFSCD